MEFIAENFPLFQLMLAHNVPGAETAKKDFEAAKTGGPAQKYDFAMGLFTVTTVPDISTRVPAFTPEIIKKTQQQAYQIFIDGAAEGNADSALMAAFLKGTGQGTEQDPRGALSLVAQAELIAGPSPFSTEMRRQLTTLYVSPQPANKSPKP